MESFAKAQIISRHVFWFVQVEVSCNSSVKSFEHAHGVRAEELAHVKYERNIIFARLLQPLETIATSWLGSLKSKQYNMNVSIGDDVPAPDPPIISKGVIADWLWQYLVILWVSSPLPYAMVVSIDSGPTQLVLPSQFRFFCASTFWIHC